MSMWLPTAPCTMQACVTEATHPVALPRRILRLLSALAVLLAGLPLALLAAQVGPSTRARLVSLWCRTMLRVLGIRLSVTGAPPEEGALLAVNHISWLDPLAVAAALPCALLAKSEVSHWPLVSTLARRGGTIFIDRSRPSTLPATVKEIARSLSAGRAVAVFPEGTTWCGRTRGPFRRAAFQAALDAQVPVQPVALSYFEYAAPTALPAFVGDTTLLRSLFRVVTARNITVRLTILPPIPPTGTRKSLTTTAESAITSALTPHPTPTAPHLDQRVAEPAPAEVS